MPVERALVSVYDKSGLAELVRQLAARGAEPEARPARRGLAEISRIRYRGRRATRNLLRTPRERAAACTRADSRGKR